MAFLDDISNLVGSGLNAVDKKKQSTMIKSSISKLNNQKKALYAQVGESAFEKLKDDPAFKEAYGEQISALADINAQEAELNARLTQLEAQVYVPAVSTQSTQSAQSAPAASGLTCPFCHAGINIDDAFCMNCGKPLDQVKDSVSRCPNCGQIYYEEVRFCEICGTKVAPLVSKASEQAPEEASAVPAASAPAEAVQEPKPAVAEPEPVFEPAAESSDTTPVNEPVASTPEHVVIAPEPKEKPLLTCQNCGQVYYESVIFCEVCGTKIEPAQTDIFESVQEPEQELYPKAKEQENLDFFEQADAQSEIEHTENVFDQNVYVPDAVPQIKFCMNCGEPLIKGALFCGGCGTRIG